MSLSARPRPLKDIFEVIQPTWFTVQVSIDALTQQFDFTKLAIYLEHPSGAARIDVTAFFDHFERTAIETKVSHIIENETRNLEDNSGN